MSVHLAKYCVVNDVMISRDLEISSEFVQMCVCRMCVQFAAQRAAHLIAPLYKPCAFSRLRARGRAHLTPFVSFHGTV